jgi:hypothetical protein
MLILDIVIRWTLSGLVLSFFTILIALVILRLCIFKILLRNFFNSHLVFNIHISGQVTILTLLIFWLIIKHFHHEFGQGFILLLRCRWLFSLIMFISQLWINEVFNINLDILFHALLVNMLVRDLCFGVLAIKQCIYITLKEFIIIIWAFVWLGIMLYFLCGLFWLMTIKCPYLVNLA